MDTHTHTDGHGNSMTDPVKRAESVKIEKLKMRGGVRKSRKIVFLLNLGIFHVFCCCHFKTYLVLLGLYLPLTKRGGTIICQKYVVFYLPSLRLKDNCNLKRQMQGDKYPKIE